jgi:hypothetical protein
MLQFIHIQLLRDASYYYIHVYIQIVDLFTTAIFLQ